MCGIVGIIGEARSDNHDFELMVRSLHHRGPDASGTEMGDGFSFGHCRLSIIDTSDGGRQPMHYLNRYVISYNGEIYNFPEIRRELEELGLEFLTHSDTEVIMAAYHAWGVDAFNCFNGMWAFCIYDKVKKKFIISRDRFGIKPLYYCFDGERFVFASEIKTILLSNIKKIEENLEYLKDYLEFGSQEFRRDTAFNGVYRFPPNTYVVAEADELAKGTFEESSYWSCVVNTSTETVEEAKLEQYSQQYFDLLKDSVEKRMRADVKVGSCLSGGLDSSSIVSLVKGVAGEESGERQSSFSVVYKKMETSSCDESEFIEILSRSLGIDSHFIEPIDHEIPVEYEKMIYHLGSPPVGSLMAGWHTFKLVGSSDVTVTLDGQGADEQLAGYESYVTNYFANMDLKEAPREYRCLQSADHKKRARKGLILNLATKFLGRKLGYRAMSKFVSDVHRYAQPLNERLYCDTVNGGLRNLLHYSDSYSMAFSIESRMPFMDYRLVEFLASVPCSYKFHRGWSKYIARVAFEKVLPDQITWRKDKMGWPIPERYWFEGEHKNWMLSKVKSSSFLNEHFGKLVSTFDDLDISKKLKLLNMAIWHEQFISKNPGSRKKGEYQDKNYML